MMIDKDDDKKTSDFDDLGEHHEEHDEFIDQFDDEPHFGKDAKTPVPPSAPVKDEFEEDHFGDEEKHDDFDDHPQKVKEEDHFGDENHHDLDELDEFDKDETEKTEEEEEEVKEPSSVVQYIKDNAIFLVIGGFFIITAVSRLYGMYAGSKPEQQAQTQESSQNLQFGQKAPAEPSKKVTVVEKKVETKTTQTATTTTPATPVAAPKEATTTVQTTETKPEEQASTQTTTTTVAVPAFPATPALPSSTTQQTTVVNTTPPPGVTETTPANATKTTTVTTAPTEAATPAESVTVTQQPQKNKAGTKISAFFDNEKPVSDKEFKQINDRIMGIEKQLSDIKALETKLTSVQTPAGAASELTDIKNQLIQTNKIVTELSNKVRSQQAPGAAPAQNAPMPSSESMTNAEVFGNPQPITNVVVQAVIPGRAWLKDTKGRLLTVQVGDMIPGYGVVVSIDAHRGIVKTDERYEFKAL